MNAIAPSSIATSMHCGSLYTGPQPEVLADIYRSDANMVIWQRKLDDALIQAAAHVVKTMPALQTVATVSQKTVADYVRDLFGTGDETAVLNDDIVQLVNMMCCLFELKYVGLRMAVLTHAMCPRFHEDKIPCRLVTTYQGIATEWLHHDCVDRSKLGAGNKGKSDDESGLFSCIDDIQSLKRGDVALLKGTSWQGNENAGLVHRSPQLNDGQSRLLLTLDFVE